MHQINLEQFQGPLDLLLQLIEKNKLQITEISLAKVTDQYLEYINDSENLAAEEVADFLLIASKLIYLKSKYLLPDFVVEEEDGVDLEKQLKIYRQYYEASKLINKMFVDKKKISYRRTTIYKPDLSGEFVPPKNLTAEAMIRAFENVLSRIKRIVELPKVVMARAMSIREKINHIQEILKSSNNINFRDLIKEKNNRTEVIVSFLAMLELVKQKEIIVIQETIFGELHINKNGE
ncbi:hypothetical protein C4566_03745 [Candidatus Parcubacteria bacterium]|nr:MAG: hypothetical protein C4566_03745 [Candidatus Parcubacteria bacterium]